MGSMVSNCLPFRYFQSFIYHVFVYLLLICLIFLFFVVVLCISPVLLFWYLVTSKKDVLFAYNKDRIDSIECEIVRSFDSKCQIDVRWTDVQLTKGDQVSVHSITCTQELSELKQPTWKPKLLVLHGVGGSGVIAMHLSGVSKRVINDFDVHTIDLPGFGRSVAPLLYATASADEVIEMIVESIKGYILQHLPGEKVYLLGHSFGGFIALQFANRCPELVDRLLLASFPGLFPVPGPLGTFVGVFYQMGLPAAPLRNIMTFGSVFTSFLGALIGSPVPLYWFQLQAQSANISDHILLKFLSSTMISTTWTSIGWKRFLLLQVPIAIVTSDTDLIVPPLHSAVISAVAGGIIPVYTIRNCGHLVMHKSDGLDFSVVIRAAYQSAVCIPSHCTVLNSDRKRIEELEEFEKSFHGLFSVYSFTATRRLIRRYFILFAEYWHDRQGLGSGSTPLLFDVDGDVITPLTSEKCRGLRPYNEIFDRFNPAQPAGNLVEIITSSSAADEKTQLNEDKFTKIDL